MASLAPAGQFTFRWPPKGGRMRDDDLRGLPPGDAAHAGRPTHFFCWPKRNGSGPQRKGPGAPQRSWFVLLGGAQGRYHPIPPTATGLPWQSIGLCAAISAPPPGGRGKHGRFCRTIDRSTVRRARPLGAPHCHATHTRQAPSRRTAPPGGRRTYFLNCNCHQVLPGNRVTGHPRRGSAYNDTRQALGRSQRLYSRPVIEL